MHRGFLGLRPSLTNDSGFITYGGKIKELKIMTEMVCRRMTADGYKSVVHSHLPYRPVDTDRPDKRFSHGLSRFVTCRMERKR